MAKWVLYSRNDKSPKYLIVSKSKPFMETDTPSCILNGGKIVLNKSFFDCFVTDTVTKVIVMVSPEHHHIAFRLHNDAECEDSYELSPHEGGAKSFSIKKLVSSCPWVSEVQGKDLKQRRFFPEPTEIYGAPTWVVKLPRGES